MKTYCLFLFSLMVMACGENGLCRDEDLFFEKKHAGSNLSLNGYYSTKYLDSSENVWKSTPVFLYKTGIAVYPPIYCDLGEENDKINTLIANNYKPVKYELGIFSIYDSIIEFSRWYVRGGCGYKSEYLKGEILNDTTFLIKDGKYKDGKDVENYPALSDTFHFRAFSPKPDSTNDFIE